MYRYRVVANKTASGGHASRYKVEKADFLPLTDRALLTVLLFESAKSRKLGANYFNIE